MTVRYLVVAVVVGMSVASGSACTAITGFGDYRFEDTGSASRDGGSMDGGPDAWVPDCAGEPDGARCGVAGRICLAGECVDSTCGDGYVDMGRGEQCEDGNDEPSDGCEPGSCTFTCREAAECDDVDPCNGRESCQPLSHVCAPGTPLGAGSPCSSRTVTGGACRPDSEGAMVCVSTSCGDLVVDDGEDCDDGNTDDTDGCTVVCRFTCRTDPDCDDRDPCNGQETCSSAHTCRPGTAPDCSDASPCTMDSCDRSTGCRHELIDGDGDGHPPDTIPGCGTDCNDRDPAIGPGMFEVVGDEVDQNCDGLETCYADRDGDGYRTVMTVTSTDSDCRDLGEARASLPAGDCDDMNAGAHPGATEVCNGFDDNCVGGIDETFACAMTSIGTCMSCGYSGARACTAACTWGACGRFTIDRLYDDTVMSFDHVCGSDFGAGDWGLMSAPMGGCDIVSGGPDLVVPPGRYELAVYFSGGGTFEFSAFNMTTRVGTTTYTSDGTDFPTVIVPFAIASGCGNISVRVRAVTAMASMRLYSITIRRVGD